MHATFDCQHCGKPLESDGTPVVCECGHGQMPVIVSVARSEEQQAALDAIEKEKADEGKIDSPQGDA